MLPLRPLGAEICRIMKAFWVCSLALRVRLRFLLMRQAVIVKSMAMRTGCGVSLLSLRSQMLLITYLAAGSPGRSRLLTAWVWWFRLVCCRLL